MLSDLIVKTAPKGSIPLVVVTEKSFAAWVKKQPQSARKWIETQSYKPKPGKYIQVPAKDGGVISVIVGLSEPVDMWDLAALPLSLPKGTYVLEGRLSQADESALALGWLLGGYRFDRYKKGEKPKAKLCLSKKIDAKPLIDMAESIAMVRDLITTPAEDMGPADLAKAIKDVGKMFGAKVSEIVGDDLLKKNYPAIHAVGRASPPERAPRLVDLTWGNPKHPKVTLVGKGVCFDTGGLDLKTSGGMYLMRKDMAGAAVAIGIAQMVMRRKLPIRLRIVLGIVDNAIDGKSFRPSDILTMRNGLTVEVGNTDAEGRLVVADALAVAVEEKPDLLISLATLGLARSAFGHGFSALFSNNEDLASDYADLAEGVNDPLWRLPLFKPYEAGLNSSFAEVNSCPSGSMGVIPAALFLQRFIPKTQCWAHLDFMAWNPSSKPGRPEGGEAMSLRATVALLEKRYPTS